MIIEKLKIISNDNEYIYEFDMIERRVLKKK